MDDASLLSLTIALRQSPDNHALRLVVVRAYFDRGELENARAQLADVDRAPDLGATDRALVARVLLAAGEHERALAVTEGGEGDLGVLRARALVALGRKEEAAQAYHAAVDKNPSLEDVDLKVQIGARERVVSLGAGAPRLRVISNDDTDQSDLARLLEPDRGRVTFADVGGLDELKKQIHKRIILPFQKPSLFQRFKKRVGGGILLYGPPGCGKTLLARATAGECRAQFFNVAINDILDMYIGESERKLHAIFEKARSSLPAVLFFDELEALAGKRQYAREGTSAKLVSQFLAEMDGFSQNNQGVLILGATNVPWAVDPAFRRPGRFDRVLFVPPPDQEARSAILSILIEGRPTSGALDLSFLAKRTSGFSGADLTNLVEAASDEAIEASIAKGDEVPVTQQHLVSALKEVKATTIEWLTTARNYARYSNEAGAYDEVLEFLNKHGQT